MTELFSRFDELLRELQEIDFRVPDDEREMASTALFGTRLLVLFDEAESLLADARRRYEAAAQEAPSALDEAESLTDIGRLISVEVAAQEIVDLLFVADTELHRHRQELVHAIDRARHATVAAACDSGLRALRRSLISVESSVYEYEEKSPPIRVWADVDVSLRTRRLYTDLGHDIRRHGPGSQDLAAALGYAAERLAAVRDEAIYPLLRYEDRAVMRQLRERLEIWASGPRDLREGQRIWQDLVAFVALLEGISLRQELQQHDRRLLRRIEETIATEASLDGLELADRLQPLYGLDRELDQLLRDGSGATVAGWRTVLDRVAHERRELQPPDLDDTWSRR